MTGDVRVRADAADALDTAILHLIRNAVDHGIEPPEERKAAGKRPAGQIRVQVRVVDDGGEVIVEDDGRGVDLAEVRRRGVALGYLQARDAERAPESELLDLLLQPGFSTRARVSDVSGRGIGLDAVRTAMARAGGRLSLTTRPGEGTIAVARVPQASRRIKVHCFRARHGALVFAVPATYKVIALAEDRAQPPLLSAPAPIDPLESLDVAHAAPAQDTRGAADDPRDRVLLIERDELTMLLHAGGSPYPRTAERFCPTGEDYPVEVVLLGDMEALLLRPDLLGTSAGR
jgi:two-component system chemotaxis sensor kinase CheA